MPKPYGLEAFIAAYTECLAWTDHELDTSDAELTDESRTILSAECEHFYLAHSESWDTGGWSDDQAGHDFALTRNGHGTGFWDRYLEIWANDETREVGKKLSEASRKYGDSSFYVGDDGCLHYYSDAPNTLRAS